MHIKYILLILLNIVVKLLTPWMYYITKPLANRSREVVYSYAIRYNVFIHNMNKNKYIKYKHYRNKYLDYLVYSFYKYFVWIWLDDAITRNNISDTKLSNYVTKNIKNVNDSYILKYIISNIDTDTKITLLESNKTKYNNKNNILLELIYLFINNETNFNYMYTYTNSKHIFNKTIYKKTFGWVPVKDINNGYVFKLV